MYDKDKYVSLIKQKDDLKCFTPEIPYPYNCTNYSQVRYFLKVI